MAKQELQFLRHDVLLDSLEAAARCSRQLQLQAGACVSQSSAGRDSGSGSSCRHAAGVSVFMHAAVQVPVEVNPELLQQLTEMGFGETRAARGLHFSGNSTLEVRPRCQLCFQD